MKRPLVFYTLSFILGILFQNIIQRTVFNTVFFFGCICIIVYVILSNIRMDNESCELVVRDYFQNKYIFISVITSMCALSGFLYAWNFVDTRVEEGIRYQNIEVDIIGIVKKVDRDKYVLKNVVINNYQIKDDMLLISEDKVNIADKVYIRGKVKIPESTRNFREFNYRKYLASNGIFLICEDYIKLEKIGYDPVNPILKLSFVIRNFVKNSINEKVPQKEAAILNALIIGDDSAITDEQYKSYKDAGMIHLMVVSGSHVAFIIAICMYILDYLQITKFRQKPLIVFIIILYILITGAEASIIRAGLVSTVVIIAGIMGRQNDSITTTFVIALIMLLYNPMVIYSIGFELSFLGALGIIVFTKPITAKLKFLPINTKEIISITIAAQLLITPILLYWFNSINLSGIFSNIFALPLTEFIMIIGLAVCIPIIGKPFGMASYICVKVLNLMAEIFANIPFLNFVLPTPKVHMIITYYVFIFGAFGFIRFKKKFLYILVAICIMLSVFPKSFTIDFIDVGHGDCIFISTNSNKTVLIDTGGSYITEDKNYNEGEDTVVPFILNQGYSYIDLLVVTHFDEDHVGGLFSIVEHLNVKAVAIGANSVKNERYNEIKNFLDKNKVKILTLGHGDSFKLDHAKFYVLNPKEGIEGSENNNSVVLMMEYRGVKALFTGDLEAEGEVALIENGVKLKADILKVGHHGSITSTSEEFVEAVSPQIAVISVGTRFKTLPNAKVMDRLKDAKVYRTDKEGGVRIIIGNDIEVTTALN